jgi:hypothetical protein
MAATHSIELPHMLSLPHAAARMGISVNALTRLISDGKMMAVQLPMGASP